MEKIFLSVEIFNSIFPKVCKNGFRTFMPGTMYGNTVDDALQPSHAPFPNLPSFVSLAWKLTFVLTHNLRKEMAKPYSRGLWGSQYFNTSSISSYLGPEWVEKHCSQFGLPEREDNVIVTRAISQVLTVKIFNSNKFNKRNFIVRSLFQYVWLCIYRFILVWLCCDF